MIHPINDRNQDKQCRVISHCTPSHLWLIYISVTMRGCPSTYPHSLKVRIPTWILMYTLFIFSSN